jgi:hypothetical protein
MRAKQTLPILLIAGLAVGCSERDMELDGILSPQFSKAVVAECASAPDHIVTDDYGLRDAMQNAEEGEVIAVDGLISTYRGAWSFVDGITITCATPGSGIVAADWQVSANNMLRIYGKGVTVTGLILDASQAPGGPIYAEYNGTTRFAEDLVFTNNEVKCGPGTCLFFAGVAGSLIADNYFESAGSETGVHVQAAGELLPDGSKEFPADWTTVLRNTVVATAPSTGQTVDCPRCYLSWGGIRIYSGQAAIVSKNVVEGPWANSLAPADVYYGRFDNNRLEDPARFGIAMSLNGVMEISTRWIAFRNNRANGGGMGGVLATSACGHVFLGNNLQRNADNTGAIFDERTGNNTLVGNGTIVTDNGGAFDCDGDGLPDLNTITGARRILSGVNLGNIVSAAASSGRNLDIH